MKYYVDYLLVPSGKIREVECDTPREALNVFIWRLKELTRERYDTPLPFPLRPYVRIKFFFKNKGAKGLHHMEFSVDKLEDEWKYTGFYEWEFRSKRVSAYVCTIEEVLCALKKFLKYAKIYNKRKYALNYSLSLEARSMPHVGNICIEYRGAYFEPFDLEEIHEILDEYLEVGYLVWLKCVIESYEEVTHVVELSLTEKGYCLVFYDKTLPPKTHYKKCFKTLGEALKKFEEFIKPYER